MLFYLFLLLFLICLTVLGINLVLFGAFGPMVFVTPWFLLLHGICLHALGITIKYLLSSLITMPIQNNNYNSGSMVLVAPWYLQLKISWNFLMKFPPLTVPRYSMVPVAPWYLWLHGTCGSMVLVAPWYLWLHGTLGSMVLVAPWYSWLHDACGFMVSMAWWFYLGET